MFLQKKLYLVIGFVLLASAAFAQYEYKEMQAARVSRAPKINGVLDDPEWAEATPADGFIVNTPVPGIAMPQNTEVKIIYTDEAVYVGFMNYDTAPDSILKQLNGRDSEGNSDVCSITFSCYQDGVNGFTFAVTPSGEQFDARETAAGGSDISWNAVWYCKTSINEWGWVAEFRIPYAALRFPDRLEQTWNINLRRDIRRTRYRGFWRGVNPKVAGFLTQMGTLKGVQGVQPPKRIFFYPYASSYLNVIENPNGTKTTSNTNNAGMDVKLGLSDAFTLDATLVPDFGQTISDQLILNLTPFEIQFQDNRQFFIEGTELFAKGGIFYSRRVGDLPLGNSSVSSRINAGETLIKNPLKSPLINATKISGRNKNGLGIGFFNGLTSATYAEVKDADGNVRFIETSPLSNYNMIVADQNLRNNSYFAIMNTNVTRNGGIYDANVTGYEFNIRNKKNTYSVVSNGAFNHKAGSTYSGVSVSNPNGFAQSISAGKISGNFLWLFGYALKSNTYDPNDMGFLTANNGVNYSLQTDYNIFKPFGKFNNLWSSLNVNYNSLYKPNTFTSLLLDGNVGLTTKKFFAYNFVWSAKPTFGYDYFEPRTQGMYFKTFRYANVGGWISSDYRKKFALDASIYYYDYENPGRYVFNWRIAPRIRLNDHLMITYVYSKQAHFNDVGYATRDSNGDPVFGIRDAISHTNVLNVAYSFNPVMQITCRVRHYWGYSQYKKFYGLSDEGQLGFTTYQGFISNQENANGGSLADRNFNSFTIDLFYRWIFTQGSELVVAWKNAIIQSDTSISPNLLDDINYTFGLPQSNSVSLRLIYFLDYRSIAHRNQTISAN